MGLEPTPCRTPKVTDSRGWRNGAGFRVAKGHERSPTVATDGNRMATAVGRGFDRRRGACPAMTFEAWTAELVRTIRETLPAAKATRRGRTATIAHGDRVAHVEMDVRTVWCRAGDGGPQGFTLVADPPTIEKARNIARSLLNHLRTE